MKRKNVDAAGTLTHLRKKVVQLCMFSKKNVRKRREDEEGAAATEKNRIFRFHLKRNAESLFS